MDLYGDKMLCGFCLGTTAKSTLVCRPFCLSIRHERRNADGAQVPRGLRHCGRQRCTKLSGTLYAVLLSFLCSVRTMPAERRTALRPWTGQACAVTPYLFSYGVGICFPWRGNLFPLAWESGSLALQRLLPYCDAAAAVYANSTKERKYA